jgi:tetraacyldisaccharide 4'-kinase
MEGDFIKVRDWLLPLSWIYGCLVRLRNFCFDVGILKSHSFSVPIIAVGNITVGGTGKTPHVEYLIKLLKGRSKIAVLSRGYKRKSKGFIVADKDSTVRDIGDEPFQMKRKYPDTIVAVDMKRVHGIKILTEQNRSLDVILLDDAFQHRYVKPGINILLVDYHRLIIYDKLLPAGRLREPLSGKNRADIVIVTKCPTTLRPMDFRVITKAMDLFPYQHLYFTTLQYECLRHINNNSTRTFASLKPDEHVLLLTGIASPQQIVEDLATLIPEGETLSKRLTSMAFPDHHDFKKKDVLRINETFAAMPSPKCIITTEKDAARLSCIEGLSDEVCQHLYSLPVNVKFMLEQEESFNENIIGYVRKNSRNSILAKEKDDNKSKDSDRSGDRPRTISFRNN